MSEKLVQKELEHGTEETRCGADRRHPASDRSRITQPQNLPQACKEAGITQQTYYRWRKEYGGLKLEQARRLKELEKENSRLRRLVTELSLEKQVLKDVAEGNF
jgi:putative transposase